MHCWHFQRLLHQLVPVAAALLLDDLVLEVLPDVLEVGGLLSGQGLADGLQSPNFTLRGRHGEALIAW